MKVPKLHKPDAAHLADNAAHAMEKLEERRSTAFGLAVWRRFSEIDGSTRAALIALELFTTVLPLLLIGYASSKSFSSNFNVGDLVVNQMALSGSVATYVRGAFSAGNAMRSVWSVVGVFGFLIWAVPFTALVARTFGLAWKRASFPLGQSILRGTVWFALYGSTLALQYALRDRAHQPGHHVGAFLAGLVTLFVFWSLTPPILVRNGWYGWRSLWVSGLTGVVIIGLILQPIGRVVVPKLLEGWMSFGSIGVALGFITWVGIIGVGWVVVACVGGVVFERTATAGTVLEAEQINPAAESAPAAPPA